MIIAVYRIRYPNPLTRPATSTTRLSPESRTRTSYPVSKLCHSHEELTREGSLIQDDLELIIDKAKVFFGGTSGDIGLQLGPDMSAEDIWSVLSKIEDEDLLVEYFNGLDDTARGAVAEHVLTRCNIFSGMAAVFSARYDNETGCLG